MMKKLAIIKSTGMMLALTACGLFTFSSTFAQKPIKKEVRVITVSDSLDVDSADSSSITEVFSYDDSYNQTFEGMEEISINLDSINCEVRKAMADIQIEMDSLPLELNIPDLELLDQDIESSADQDHGGKFEKRVEVKRVDDSNPKELEETLRKLELEGKITTKGEYSGVQTISVITNSKQEEKVWLQPKGKKEWIDAKTGEPVKMKYRAMRMPRHARHHRTIRMSCDSTNLGGPRHINISRGNGRGRQVIVIDSDSINAMGNSKNVYYITSDSTGNKMQRGKRPHRITVTSNCKSGDDVEVTVISDDSSKTVSRKGKSQVFVVRTDSKGHKGKGMRNKTLRVRVQMSDNISAEEKTMLEKSGFKKEKADKQLSDENLTIIPNTDEGRMKVVFNAEGKGTVLIKIADSKGTVLADDKNPLKNGSFEKEYTLQQPADGIFFLQVTFDGKSLTRKIQIKN